MPDENPPAPTTKFYVELVVGKSYTCPWGLKVRKGVPIPITPDHPRIGWFRSNSRFVVSERGVRPTGRAPGPMPVRGRARAKSPPVKPTKNPTVKPPDPVDENASEDAPPARKKADTVRPPDPTDSVDKVGEFARDESADAGDGSSLTRKELVAAAQALGLKPKPAHNKADLVAMINEKKSFAVEKAEKDAAAAKLETEKPDESPPDGGQE